MLNRRDFLKLIGLGGVSTGAGFVLKEAMEPPVAKLIPYLVPPEDTVPGVANWYAGLCTQCSAGCGVITKTMEGRAKKIEGNPLHPINRGKLCARGQAGLQVLYNPDRVKGPLKRVGKRGEGEFREVSWEEGLSILSGNLKDLTNRNEAGKLYLLTSALRGHLTSLLVSFMDSFGSSNYFQYELFNNSNLIYANSVTIGSGAIPDYDIANTRLLLSFGADFMGTWLSPVRYARSYGDMRQGRPGVRGRFVQIEPRLSMTGASADEWVPVRPGTEGILALSIAYLIVEERHYRGADAKRWMDMLKRYNPDEVAGEIDISVRKIGELAEEFVEGGPSLAIGGDNLASYDNGIGNLVAVNVLNYLAGSIGHKGGVLLNGKDKTFKRKSVPYAQLTKLGDSALEGDIETLILYNTNPLFTAPSGMKLGASLENIPLIVSLSSFMDETTGMADLILPAHTSLEDWGDDFADHGAGYSVATVMQPAVSPVFDTKGVGDVFLALAASLGPGFKKDFPWRSFGDFLKDAWKKIYRRNRGSGIKERSFEDFWSRLLAAGGWWTPSPKISGAVNLSVGKASSHIPSAAAGFDGDSDKFPFFLTVYSHSAFLDGRGANLPWLQEMPDPMTSVVWGTWVEMNPKTARHLSLKEGDMIRVESPYGEIHAPLYLYPGIRPDTVAVPIGQGHTSYGRYAKERGDNPLAILPPRVDTRTGALALNSTRVRVFKSTRSGKLVKMEGSARELGRGIVQTVSNKEFKKMGKEA